MDEEVGDVDGQGADTGPFLTPDKGRKVARNTPGLPRCQPGSGTAILILELLNGAIHDPVKSNAQKYDHLRLLHNIFCDCQGLALLVIPKASLGALSAVQCHPQ